MNANKESLIKSSFRQACAGLDPVPESMLLIYLDSRLDSGFLLRSRLPVPDAIYLPHPWGRTAYLHVGVRGNDEYGINQTFLNSLQIFFTLFALICVYSRTDIVVVSK